MSARAALIQGDELQSLTLINPLERHFGSSFQFVLRPLQVVLVTICQAVGRVSLSASSAPASIT